MPKLTELELRYCCINVMITMEVLKTLLLRKIKTMKRAKLMTLYILLFVGITSQLTAQTWADAQLQKKGVLHVSYFENEPYAYQNGKGDLSGIEIDILRSFVKWAKEEKGVNIKLEFTAHKDFNNFFEGMYESKINHIGLGSLAITEERGKTMNFSAPYLKNVSVLITDGSVPTARTRDVLLANAAGLKPVTIKGSIHQEYLVSLYNEAGVKPAYEYVAEAQMIPAKIKENSKYFGYVDIISFWKYLKENNHYIKMHSIANKKDEYFGFALSKNSDWIIAINEFFESGFGFTATKEYHHILEKHLGFEIMEKVEIDE